MKNMSLSLVLSIDLTIMNFIGLIIWSRRNICWILFLNFWNSAMQITIVKMEIKMLTGHWSQLARVVKILWFRSFHSNLLSLHGWLIFGACCQFKLSPSPQLWARSNVANSSLWMQLEVVADSKIIWPEDNTIWVRCDRIIRDFESKGLR